MTYFEHKGSYVRTVANLASKFPTIIKIFATLNLFQAAMKTAVSSVETLGIQYLLYEKQSTLSSTIMSTIMQKQ